MNHWNTTALLVAGVFIMSSASADTPPPANLNINISGTVVANGSCTFNKGETVSVDFGDVTFTETNGGATISGNYRKSVPSVMSCSGDTAGKTQITLSAVGGNTVDYQGQKLLPVTIAGGTPGEELAIRLLVDGVAKDVNSPFIVDMTSQPGMQAELIQVGDGKGLISGAKITATATLVMEFA